MSCSERSQADYDDDDDVDDDFRSEFGDRRWQVPDQSSEKVFWTLLISSSLCPLESCKNERAEKSGLSAQ